MTSIDSIVNDDDLEWDDDVRTLDGLPYTGRALLTHSNGNPEADYRYESGFKEGLCEERYASGQLRKQWTAKRGVAVGDVRTWHENGQLKSVGNYEFGVELSYDEWDGTGRLIESRRIDKDSELMKYVETMRERASQ